MNTLLKKSSIFANLLMEKPDNSFAMVKREKTPEKKKKKKRICIFTQKFSLGQFSVPACAVFSSCFSVRPKLTPNELFQTISGLKSINGLHQTTLSTKTLYIYIYIYIYMYTYCSI